MTLYDDRIRRAIAANRAIRRANPDGTTRIRQGVVECDADAETRRGVAAHYGVPVRSSCGCPNRSPRRRNPGGNDAALAEAIASALADQRLAKLRAALVSLGTLPASQIGKAVEEVAEQVRETMRIAVRAAFEPDEAPASGLRIAGEADDLTTPSKPRERVKRNVEAINLIASRDTSQPLTGADRRAVLQYSGFGGIRDPWITVQKTDGPIPHVGLSPDLKAQIPATFPDYDPLGLINEFYTPWEVTRSVSAQVRRIAAKIGVKLDGARALEPSAGIGRFIEPLADEGLHWTTVEYSKISALMLDHLYPAANRFHGSFEAAVYQNYGGWFRSFDLILANPPYGERGETVYDDPDEISTKHRRAHSYFVERLFDLAAEDGLVVLVIPGGLLSGTGAEYTGLRREMLRRWHLWGAVRLPSDIFPGASVPEIDVVFASARGAILDDVLRSDASVAAGDYFEQYPAHVLGELKEGGRYGKMMVVGPFNGIPDFELRPRHNVPAGTADTKPFNPRTPLAAGDRLVLGTEGDPIDIAVSSATARAIQIGDRFVRHRQRMKSAQPEAARQAAMAWPELAADARDLHEAAPDLADDADFALLAEEGCEGAASWIDAARNRAWQRIVEAPPSRVARTIPDIAERIHSATRDAVTMNMLREEAEATSTEPWDAEKAIASLAANGWCLRVTATRFAGAGWVPQSDYYVGNVWPEYDAITALLERKDATVGAMRQTLTRQLAELTQRMDLVTGGDLADVSPDASWMPVEALNAWWKATGAEWEWPYPDERYERSGKSGVELRRVDGSLVAWRLLKAAPVDFVNLRQTLKKLDITDGLRLFLAWCNGNTAAFQPYRPKDARADMAKLRFTVSAMWARSFQEWLLGAPEWGAVVAEAYNRARRGYITRTHYDETLPWLERWQGPDTLRPHQAEGANRAVEERGALLAFDVGVGKTHTALGVIARSRAELRARRPALIVPLPLAVKWRKDFARNLPEYRVALVGLEIYEGRDGNIRSRTDKGSERAQKWRDFAAGLYDACIVTIPWFPYIGMTEAQARRYVARYVGQQMGRKQRAASQAFENAYDEAFKEWRESPETRAVIASGTLTGSLDAAFRKSGLAPSPKGATGRDETKERLKYERQIQDRIRLPAKKMVSGVTWTQARVDLLVADEAHAYKALFAPTDTDFGNVRGMGSSGGKGNAIAPAFDLRAFDCRENGGAVVLLTATPATNSPLELYNLLQYIDPDWFAARGIETPDEFCRAFIELGTKVQATPKGTAKQVVVVAGFKQLDDLRRLVLRWSVFLNAEDVNLKVPDASSDFVEVDLTHEQSGLMTAWRAWAAWAREELATNKNLTDDEQDQGKAAQMLTLIHQRIVAHHPDLTVYPVEDLSVEYETASYQDVKKKVERGLIDLSEAPKAQACAEWIASNRTGGHIVFADVVPAHPIIKACLVEAGIPENRIATMNGIASPTPMDRSIIADKFNGDPDQDIAPEYDVVIANKIAEQGIDLQTRTVAIHHLDLPWTPSAIQQRNGRGLRQGNENSTVVLRYYAARRSADGYWMNMLDVKANWLGEIISGTNTQTGNPAEAGDVRQDPLALLLLTSENEEEARRLYEEFQADSERKALQEKRAAAQNLLMRYARAAEGARHAKTAELAAQGRRTAERLRDELLALPASVVPYRERLRRVMDEPCVVVRVAGLPPVFSGDVIHVPHATKKDPGKRIQLVVGALEDGNADSIVFRAEKPEGAEYRLYRTLDEMHVMPRWMHEGERVRGNPSRSIADLVQHIPVLDAIQRADQPAEPLVIEGASALPYNWYSGIAFAPAAEADLVFRLALSTVDPSPKNRYQRTRGMLPHETPALYNGELIRTAYDADGANWLTGERAGDANPYVQVDLAAVEWFRPDLAGFAAFCEALRGREKIDWKAARRVARSYFARGIPNGVRENGALALRNPPAVVAMPMTAEKAARTPNPTALVPLAQAILGAHSLRQAAAALGGKK